MDREEFEKRLKEDVPSYSNEELRGVINRSLSPLAINGNGTKNLVIVAEEFMEAGIEITKILRGKKDAVGLVEELADAYLSIKYAQEICGIPDDVLDKAINVKIERQDKRSSSGNW